MKAAPIFEALAALQAVLDTDRQYAVLPQAIWIRVTHATALLHAHLAAEGLTVEVTNDPA